MDKVSGARNMRPGHAFRLSCLLEHSFASGDGARVGAAAAREMGRLCLCEWRPLRVRDRDGNLARIRGQASFVVGWALARVFCLLIFGHEMRYLPRMSALVVSLGSLLIHNHGGQEGCVVCLSLPYITASHPRLHLSPSGRRVVSCCVMRPGTELRMTLLLLGFVWTFALRQ